MIHKDKRGQATIFLVILLIGAFFLAIFLVIGGIVVIKMNDALNQDIDLGQVNLKDVNEDTFGKFYTMYLIHADWWGIAVIFGMAFGLFLSAYMMRNRFPKWGLIIDIFIIFTTYIVSVYISSFYQILLDALNSAGEDFLEVYVIKTSMFITNLPIFVTIIGVIVMVLLHASIPKKDSERLQSGGVLQGI